MKPSQDPKALLKTNKYAQCGGLAEKCRTIERTQRFLEKQVCN